MSTKAKQHEDFIDYLGLRHFPGSEFTPCWSRTRNGVKNSVPPEALWPNIVKTILVLDELRESLGSSIAFNSTYRSPSYNKAIEGEPASFHMQYIAIDFRCTSGSSGDWAAALKGWRGKKFALPGNGGEFEFRGGIGIYPTFVHIDTRGYDANWDNR